METMSGVEILFWMFGEQSLAFILNSEYIHVVEIMSSLCGASSIGIRGTTQHKVKARKWTLSVLNIVIFLIQFKCKLRSSYHLRSS